MNAEHYIFALFIAALICAVAVVIKVLFSNVKKQQKMLEEREAEILKTYNAVETIMEEFQDQSKATLDELKKREQEYREVIMNMPVIPQPEAAATPAPPVPAKPARPLPPEEARVKAAGDVIERAEKYIVPEKALDVPPNVHIPVLQNNGTAPISVVPPKVAQAAYATLPPQKATQSVLSTGDQKGKAKTPVFQKFFDDAVEAPPPTPYAPAAIKGGTLRDKILDMAEQGKTDVEIARDLDISRNEVQLVIGMTKK